MQTSGFPTETRLTVAVFVIAVGFLVVLAGGPTQFMLDIEHTLEAVVKNVSDVYQGMRA